MLVTDIVDTMCMTSPSIRRTAFAGSEREVGISRVFRIARTHPPHWAISRAARVVYLCGRRLGRGHNRWAAPPLGLVDRDFDLNVPTLAKGDHREDDQDNLDWDQQNHHEADEVGAEPLTAEDGMGGREPRGVTVKPARR